MLLRCPLHDKKYTPWALLAITILFGMLYWHLYAESVPALHIHFGSLSFNHVNVLSLEYFNFLTNKPNGYPLFLSLMQAIAQTKTTLMNIIILSQLIIFLLAAWYFSLQFYSFSNRRSLSFLLLFLILGNPEIVKFCFLVMTESFMISLLILILALSCRWATQPKVQEQQKTLILLSSCLGTAMLFRTICAAWIIAIFCVLAVFYGRSHFTWHERFRALKFFLIPIVACWILGASFHYYKFGTFKNETQLNNFFLFKVNMILNPQDLESPSPFIKAFLSYHEPMHELIQHARTSKMKYWITQFYSDLTINMLPNITLAEGRNAPPEIKLVASIKDMDTQSQQAFIQLSMHYPMRYLKDVMMNYVALWQFWELMTPEDIHEFLQFEKTYGPLYYPFFTKLNLNNLTPFYALQAKLNDYTTWPPFLFFIRVVMGLIWGVTLYFFGAALLCLLNKKQSTPPLWAGLIGATLLQATYLLTASVTTGFFRYAIVMWPAVVFVGVTFLLLFLTSPTKARIKKL